MNEQKEIKNQIIKKIEDYKIRNPSADVKTMPQGLRKEVKEYIQRFIGSYSQRVKVIKSLKFHEFLDKYEDKEKKKTHKELKVLIKNFDNKISRLKLFLKRLTSWTPKILGKFLLNMIFIVSYILRD